MQHFLRRHSGAAKRNPESRGPGAREPLDSGLVLRTPRNDGGGMFVFVGMSA